MFKELVSWIMDVISIIRLYVPLAQILVIMLAVFLWGFIIHVFLGIRKTMRDHGEDE